jgi:phosphatidylserine/phosphatidylglycerophosphate/cardiolipin synthase-like enzyme
MLHIAPVTFNIRCACAYCMWAQCKNLLLFHLKMESDRIFSYFILRNGVRYCWRVHRVLLCRYVQSARRSLDLCVYTITCSELVDVIVAASHLGVVVRVITDNEQIDASGSQVGRFRMEGPNQNCLLWN